MSREITKKLLENMDEGCYDLPKMIQDLLGWMSEDDVKEFALQNNYLLSEFLDEEDDDSYL